MYAEFSTDPKVQMLSEADQRRYMMLLCLRCGNGDVTLQDESVTFMLRITDEEWQRTKAVLQSKNLIDEDNKPTAWEKRQYASDSSAERVSKHRASKKQQSNGDVTLQSRPVEAETETEKEVNTFVISGADDARSSAKVESIDDCPQKEILALYAEVLPELPQPRIWDGQRAKALSQRWRWVLADLKARGKPHSRADGLEFFRGMFGYILKSDFLMGRSGRWSADLGWISKAENFAKILQGNYENKEQAA